MMSFLARWPGRASWGSLSLLDLIGAGGLALIAQGLKTVQEVGVRVICSGQRTPAIIYSVMTQKTQTFIPGHFVRPPVTQFPHFLPHLVHVSLQRRSIRQKLVVQPGLLHCLLHIVAEP